MGRYRVHYIEGSGENLRIRKEQTVEAPSFQDAGTVHALACRRGLRESPACAQHPGANFAIWRRGKFSLLGRVDFGEGRASTLFVVSPLFPQYPVSPDANAVRIRPSLAKRSRRGPCCIKERVACDCGNRKRARMHNASGLFSLVERREGLGQWRFEQLSRFASPISQSLWEGGRGGPF